MFYKFPFTQPDLFGIFGHLRIFIINQTKVWVWTMPGHVTKTWKDKSAAGFKMLSSYLTLPYQASLSALPFSRAFSPRGSFLHITPAGESVSSLCVCSYGQVKWPDSGRLPSMAGWWVLRWGSVCLKMLGPTPAWQRTAQGRRPAALLCSSEVRGGHRDTPETALLWTLEAIHAQIKYQEISIQHNLILNSSCKM